MLEDMRRARRLVVIMALVGSSACDTMMCRRTDDPGPEPWVWHQPDQRYESEEGRFEVFLRPEQGWPTAVGRTSLRLEWRAIDPAVDGEASLQAEPPWTRDDMRPAATDPTAVELEPSLWRIERLELDAPGGWVLPLWFQQGQLDDGIELHLEVVTR
jgi:hypothetical protein